MAVGTTWDDAMAAAATETGDEVVLLSESSWEGFDEIPLWVTEGYATVFEEVTDELETRGRPAPDAVLVPLGIGALASAASQLVPQRAVLTRPVAGRGRAHRGRLLVGLAGGRRTGHPAGPGRDRDGGPGPGPAVAVGLAGGVERARRGGGGRRRPGPRGRDAPGRPRRVGQPHRCGRLRRAAGGPGVPESGWTATISWAGPPASWSSSPRASWPDDRCRPRRWRCCWPGGWWPSPPRRSTAWVPMPTTPRRWAGSSRSRVGPPTTP